MRRRGLLLPLLTAALAVSGCASESSGYSRVDARQIVLVPATATDGAPSASVGAGAALACGARAEATRLHERLRVAAPARPTASAQILVLDAVTALKPGGVIVVPVAARALLAPIVSMRKAGIHVVPLAAVPSSAGAAAREGALAVARAVGAIRGTGPPRTGRGMSGSIPPATTRGCDSP